MSQHTDPSSTGFRCSECSGAHNADSCPAPATAWKSTTGVAVVIRGQGPPVFLMHGIGGSAHTCAALARELAAEGYRALCWDAPGYGESADPAGEIDHAAVALEALSELGIDKAHFIGTSWGGVIAALIAAGHPGRVLSVVLMDSTRGSGRTDESARKMLDRLPELEVIGAAAFAGKRATRLVSPRAAAGMVEAVRSDMSRIRPPGYGAAARMMAASDTSDALATITAPSLVLVGDDDIVTGVEESRLLARIIPGAQFASIPDAGHAAIQEKPREVASLIINFWKKPL